MARSTLAGQRGGLAGPMVASGSSVVVAIGAALWGRWNVARQSSAASVSATAVRVLSCMALSSPRVRPCVRRPCGVAQGLTVGMGRA